MRARHAREIRRGIMIARDVLARRRMKPRGLSLMGDAPLWQEAYHHTMHRNLNRPDVYALLSYRPARRSVLNRTPRRRHYA